MFAPGGEAEKKHQTISDATASGQLASFRKGLPSKDKQLNESLQSSKVRIKETLEMRHLPKDQTVYGPFQKGRRVETNHTKIRRKTKGRDIENETREVTNENQYDDNDQGPCMREGIDPKKESTFLTEKSHTKGDITIPSHVTSVMKKLERRLCGCANGGSDSKERILLEKSDDDSSLLTSSSIVVARLIGETYDGERSITQDHNTEKDGPALITAPGTGSNERTGQTNDGRLDIIKKEKTRQDTGNARKEVSVLSTWMDDSHSFFCCQEKPCCEHCQQPFSFAEARAMDFCGSKAANVKGIFHPSCRLIRIEMKKLKNYVLRQISIFGHLKRKLILESQQRLITKIEHGNTPRETKNDKSTEKESHRSTGPVMSQKESQPRRNLSRSKSPSRHRRVRSRSKSPTKRATSNIKPSRGNVRHKSPGSSMHKLQMLAESTIGKCQVSPQRFSRHQPTLGSQQRGLKDSTGRRTNRKESRRMRSPQRGGLESSRSNSPQRTVRKSQIAGITK